MKRRVSTVVSKYCVILVRCAGAAGLPLLINTVLGTKLVSNTVQSWSCARRHDFFFFF